MFTPRSAFLATSILLLTSACSTLSSHRPLSIEPDLNQEAAILAAVARLRAVAPPAKKARAASFREGLHAAKGAERARVLESLAKRDHSVSWRHAHGALEVIHHLSAGLVGLPLSSYLERMDPARHWGRSLAKHRGGDWKQDSEDEAGRPRQLRERMVLGTPWFALCAPDQDVEKHELARFGEGFVEIDWIVTHSPDDSVEIDEGYVRFEAVTLAGEPATMILFESVHRFDPGPFGRLGPKSLVEKALRSGFLGHLGRYRALASAPTPGSVRTRRIRSPRNSSGE